MAEDFFKTTVARLAAGGVDSPRLEARLLLAFAANEPAEDFCPWRELSPTVREKAEKLIARRLAHEPLDKIVGRRSFYKYDFAVSKDVLSPRPDSEVLVEAAAALIKEHDWHTVLDLGTGSGCLLLSLLADFPMLSGCGADVSPAALAVAAKNARALCVEKRAELLRFDYFADDFDRRFDLIVSNPPYIPTAEIAALEAEVKDYDPQLALDGGADGLNHYRRLADVAGKWLEEGGRMLLEVGCGQAGDVSTLFAAAGWQTTEILNDLSGIARCVILKK